MPGMRLVLNMHSYCDEHMGIVFCSISWKEKQKGTGQIKRAERALMGYVANEMLQHFFLREQGCQSILGHGAVKKVWTQWVRMEGEGSSAKKKEKNTSTHKKVIWWRNVMAMRRTPAPLEGYRVLEDLNELLQTAKTDSSYPSPGLGYGWYCTTAPTGPNRTVPCSLAQRAVPPWAQHQKAWNKKQVQKLWVKFKLICKNLA